MNHKRGNASYSHVWRLNKKSQIGIILKDSKPKRTSSVKTISVEGDKMCLDHGTFSDYREVECSWTMRI